MNIKLDTNKIAQLLTLSTRQLNEATVSALASARRNALKRQTAHSPVYALTTGRWTHSLIPHSAQQWVVAGLLAAMLVVGTSFWHHVQEQQTDELDVAILTDDLPIEVFVD